MLARFADERALDVARAGGKGASLARMAASGLPVPPGFVVLAEALSAALDATGLRDELRAAQPDHARAQKLIERLPLVELAGAYDALGERDPAVAVRSSAVAEDSDAASIVG